MIKNLERLNSWLTSRNKKTTTKTFKEADEEFQELMETINKKISAGNSVTTSDNIISPNHYTSDKGFEVFDVQEAFIHDLKGMAASYWCNVVKYILRFQNKNGVEDLKKAKYYLEKLIEEEGSDNE